MDKLYDVIMVGSGIANIMAILKILQINPNIKILMLEKGNVIHKRVCPKETTGKCMHCKNCYLFGWGGAGTFSDSKLSYSPDIGGTVIEYIGEDNFNKYLNEADEIFTRFGGTKDFSDDEDYANSLAYECSKYGMKLIKSKFRHLGTDGSQMVMNNIYRYLMTFPNLQIKCNCEVTDIIFDNKEVYYQENGTEHCVKGTNIVIGVGRDGSNWLNKLCRKQGVKILNAPIDIGVRVECPAAITDDVTDKLYEFKVVNYSDTNKVRTFCVNPNGFVVNEKYDDDIICVNGHSYLDKKSMNTNFALLVSCSFTEPFNEPIKFGKTLCSYINMLTNGKVMVQRLVDLKNKKRTNKDRLKRLSIDPTLKDAEAGDLRYALPSNVLDSIIQTIDNLSNVMPNLNGPNTILYAPEVKFYSSLIDVKDNLELKDYQGIYCIGDSSGITHGIMQSSISGLFVANDMLKE